jgi:hypothetical protein
MWLSLIDSLSWELHSTGNTAGKSWTARKKNCARVWRFVE